jgi:hypothetical protein
MNASTETTSRSMLGKTLVSSDSGGEAHDAHR